MKIAIITIHRVHNYGTALQAYATQRLFRQMGHDAVVIDYITPQRRLSRLLAQPPSSAANCGKLKGTFLHLLKMVSLLLRNRTFARFLKRHLSLTKRYMTAEDLQKDPPEADLYVTGSDQTWNSKYNEGIDRGFFLDFLPENAPRISFVSSFGADTLPADEIARTRTLIHRYRGLSVREDSAKQILAQLGRPDAVQLIDPTLQIPKEEWVALASRRLVKEPYLLLFLLYNEDNGATEYARQIARERRLKLVKLSWELKAPAGVDILMTHRSPEDFLSLMHHADFVVTNSFHGLAFSINLEKQFFVVPRIEFNARIESLLRLTGLQSRAAVSADSLREAQTAIDYDAVRHILEAERSRAKAFLSTYLDTETP